MDGLWSNPCDVPRVAYDEEADGDIRTLGTGALIGYGVGGHLADVLSKVSASDFPRLDFASEQSKAGAAESWMKLMGLKMSTASMDVAEFWECTEQEVRGKYDL